MNCDQARELILTDAIDAEISMDDKRELLTHLVACESCRLLMDRAEADLMTPFEQAGRLVPPPELWRNIERELDRTALQTDSETGVAGPGFFARLRHLIPQAVRPFALATAVLLIAALFSFYHPEPPMRTAARLSPAASALMLICERDSAFEEALVRNIQFDTPIEKLFF